MRGTRFGTKVKIMNTKLVIAGKFLGVFICTQMGCNGDSRTLRKQCKKCKCLNARAGSPDNPSAKMFSQLLFVT